MQSYNPAIPKTRQVLAVNALPLSPENENYIYAQAGLGLPRLSGLRQVTVAPQLPVNRP